ncbi:hypothetical protein [Sphingomonas panacis]|uniref:hypothetical protein n=1 Tax=Sphingomonas panacis TaxID=1560345 RepID=UPI0012377195|nr:hypothetical protein [Sphingomonas panacis]
MTGSIDGRWLIDFGNDRPAEACGNEIVLGGGVVALARTGVPIGHYDVSPGELTLTLPLPALVGEGAWQMIGRFALPDDVGTHANLVGVMQGVHSGGDALDHPCMLRRRASQA